MTEPVSPDAARRQPLDARAMRQINLSLVLSAVVRQPSISQPELVDVTRLKKATVSTLLDELVRLGWVRASGAAPGLVGRPRALFVPNPARGVVVSARISVDGVSALVVDFGGLERGRRVEQMDVAATPQPEVADALRRVLDRVLREGEAGDGRVLGAALALPGIVDAGRLGYAPGLQWPDRNATALLRTALGRHLADDATLLVGNEARFAALGEQRYGAAAGADDFVYLLGEVGVGAGVVVDGRLFRGTRGAAGEVGHVSVELGGRPCSCGKVGCWAAYVGQDELVRLAERERDQGRASSLWPAETEHRRGEPRLTPDLVLAAAREGDRVASDCVALVRRYLAAGIGNLVSVYDPELVVLGGFLGTAFGPDLALLRAEVDQWVMGGGVYSALRLETSRIEGASLWGGVSLVHEHLVRAPRPT